MSFKSVLSQIAFIHQRRLSYTFLRRPQNRGNDLLSTPLRQQMFAESQVIKGG